RRVERVGRSRPELKWRSTKRNRQNGRQPSHSISVLCHIIQIFLVIPCLVWTFQYQMFAFLITLYHSKQKSAVCSISKVTCTTLLLSSVAKLQKGAVENCDPLQLIRALHHMEYSLILLSTHWIIVKECSMLCILCLFLFRMYLIQAVKLSFFYFLNPGWESQLLETGFLAIFLCPVWTLSQIPRRCPPSLICIWTFRWLIVRIMLGAGLIKIRGDKCWRDLTCMDYHYETQPVPNPVSYYLHRSPWWFHRFETLSNHFIELIAPFFTFLGRRMCMVNGVIQILFQVVLILSGNLSFLNWLTIVPSLACFDDKSLAFLFRSGGGAKKTVLEIQNEARAGRPPKPTRGMLMRRVVNVSLAVLIGYLSIPVVMNLLSSRQVMNTSFDPLRIVNTYGAFGSITKERTEVIFQGTLAKDPKDPEAIWEEYQFLCKPGDVNRRPCLISPYHYRLDWLMWFAAFQTYEQSEWVIHIAGRLLANDSTVLSLMDHNPFQDRGTPRWVRGEHFRYKFSQPGSSSAAQGKWWLRKRIGAYFPPVDLEGLRGYFQSRNWPHPHIPQKKS
uniref:Lipase maturation factor n=1 Tax=Sphaeramia orbicularis TaxID=375764 RepID=A0A673AM87_9TELE